jgi:hypothetical protein
MKTKAAISEILLNTWGFFFRKVAFWRYEVHISGNE